MKRNIITVPIRRVEGAQVSMEQDWLAVEEPLEIRLGGKNVAITMRTPGNDRELAAGFLFTEGMIKNPGQIAAVEVTDRNVAAVALTEGNGVDLTRLDRHFYMSSSCGVCGKASIDALEAAECPGLERDQPQVDPAAIHGMPETLRARQAVFERTGGLHAAALFHATGELLDVREDVGRHNAVEKLIGAAFLDGKIPLNRHVLLVSGRASFELVQKAVMAGIGVMAAVGAPSSLAVEAALRYGMTLAGFVRGGRFNVYSGEWRLSCYDRSCDASVPSSFSPGTEPPSR